VAQAFGGVLPQCTLAMRVLDDPAHGVGARRTGSGKAQGTGRVPWVGLHSVIRLATKPRHPR
jgi:hypothetical protein